MSREARLTKLRQNLSENIYFAQQNTRFHTHILMKLKTAELQWLHNTYIILCAQFRKGEEYNIHGDPLMNTFCFARCKGKKTFADQGNRCEDCKWRLQNARSKELDHFEEIIFWICVSMMHVFMMHVCMMHVSTMDIYMLLAPDVCMIHISMMWLKFCHQPNLGVDRIAMKCW